MRTPACLLQPAPAHQRNDCKLGSAKCSVHCGYILFSVRFQIKSCNRLVICSEPILSLSKFFERNMLMTNRQTDILIHCFMLEELEMDRWGRKMSPQCNLFLHDICSNVQLCVWHRIIAACLMKCMSTYMLKHLKNSKIAIWYQMCLLKIKFKLQLY